MESLISEQHPIVAGRPARAFIGGRGPALLLIHGAWGGAAMHWRNVWNELAERFYVIAPDLPGIGDLEQPGLGSLPEYVGWLQKLLDAIGVKQAFCVGESIGASLAWSFAGRLPERTLGVVMVNGVPVGKTPALIHWLGQHAAGRVLMRALARRVAFTPGALKKAFAETHHAPPELDSPLAGTPKERLELFARCLAEGDGAPEPKVPQYVIWGDQDRLSGSARALQKLKAAHPFARVAHIGGAGHFPPIEQPEAFVKAVRELLPQ